MHIKKTKSKSSQYIHLLTPKLFVNTAQCNVKYYDNVK